MSMSDELARLGELHQQGVLSDDEFSRAKARVLAGTAPTPPAGSAALSALNALRRSRNDRWLGGVCGGLGDFTGVASWAWRLMFTLLMLCAGTGVLVYILMWIFVPEGEPPLVNGHASRTA